MTVVTKPVPETKPLTAKEKKTAIGKLNAAIDSMQKNCIVPLLATHSGKYSGIYWEMGQYMEVFQMRIGAGDSELWEQTSRGKETFAAWLAKRFPCLKGKDQGGTSSGDVWRFRARWIRKYFDPSNALFKGMTLPQCRKEAEEYTVTDAVALARAAFARKPAEKTVVEILHEKSMSMQKQITALIDEINKVCTVDLPQRLLENDVPEEEIEAFKILMEDLENLASASNELHKEIVKVEKVVKKAVNDAASASA